MEQPELEQYCTDQSPQAGERLVEHYFPLVRSVCRRYLRQSQDVEDAVQETFFKLMRHAASIDQDLQGWLTTTAYSSSIDLIRRAGSDDRRRRNLEQLRSAHLEHRLLHEGIEEKLHTALLELDQPGRELIVDRFVRKTPLRVIAGKQGTSVATVSRRVSGALANLAAVLRDMGLESADDFSVVEHFGQGFLPDVDLRFAPDWQSAVSGQQAAGLPAWLPGWTRPVRVGVLVSHLSTRTTPVEIQVRITRFVSGGAFQMVGIVEKGTSQLPTIERTLRDYELLGGLIDSGDTLALQTLDVIILGNNHGIGDATARALADAVRAGVGLIREHRIGNRDNPDVRALMLTDSPIGMACARFWGGECGGIAPGTVLESHPALPGFSSGATVGVRGCGPVFKVIDTAKVLICKDHPVTPEEHGIAGLGTIRPPALVAGQLGRGRVMFHHKLREDEPRAEVGYMSDLLAWLAEPRRLRGR